MGNHIDYCTIFSGPNAGILARLSYNSLFKVSDLSDVNFHVIIKDVSSDDISQIHSLLEGCPTEWYRSPRYMVKRGPLANTLDELPTENFDDVAHTCDFIMKSCGYSQWCILAHFDMVYEKDLLSLCRQRIAPDVALIGQHERFVMINRKAYAQSELKFRSLSHFFAVPAWPPPQHGHYQLHYKTDPRVGVDAIPVRGFDTGELLELEMMALGWRVEPMLLELRECITHFGGGGSSGASGYSESVIATHRERALRLIEERGL